MQEPVKRIGAEDDQDIDNQDIADDIDMIIATISFTLTDFVENLTLLAGD